MEIEQLIDRIHLADAYELVKQIPPHSVDMVMIDPPYKIETNGGGAVGTKINQRANRRDNELIDNDIISGIDNEVLDDIVRCCKKINCFVWCNKGLVIQLLDYFVKGKGCNFEIMGWCKTNPIPTINNTWLPDIEYCLYFREPGIELRGGVEMRRKWWTTPINKADKDRFGHPTIKPLPIIKQLIQATTDAGDLVLDCFIGSGTTAIACKETNRHFIGVEKNPKWHKVACDRLNGIDASGQISLFLR